MNFKHVSRACMHALCLGGCVITTDIYSGMEASVEVNASVPTRDALWQPARGCSGAVNSALPQAAAAPRLWQLDSGNPLHHATV